MCSDELYNMEISDGYILLKSPPAIKTFPLCNTDAVWLLEHRA